MPVRRIQSGDGAARNPWSISWQARSRARLVPRASDRGVCRSPRRASWDGKRCGASHRPFQRCPTVNHRQAGEDEVGGRQPGPAPGIGEVRAQVEDECAGHKTNAPEQGEKPANGASERGASSELIREEECAQAEADQTQTDERVVNPEQLADKSWQRTEMLAQAHDTWHQQT